jgi:hypothetical protein
MANGRNQNKPVHGPDTTAGYFHNSITIKLTRDSDLQAIADCGLM